MEIVLSNKADAGALDIAKEHGVKTAVVENVGVGRVEHEENITGRTGEIQVRLCCPAGYMRVLSPVFLKHYRDDAGYFRIINIHPSMLPAFPGKDAYGDAFAAQVKESGITIHLIDEEVDHGPILAQRSFPRLEGDTLETFKHRGLAIEHKLYPEVLQKISDHGLLSLIKEHVAK